MQIITGDTDSFYGLAIRYTGSPDKAQAIADYNGMVQGTPLDAALEPGLEIVIPDGWIKVTPLLIESVGFGIPAQRYWAVAGIVLILFILATNKHH